MSRIEVAMEKAALLRQGVAEPGAPEAVEPELRSVSTKPLLRNMVPVLQPLQPTNPFLVSLHDPQSQTAEEYRKLKTALVKMTRDQGFRNAIAVTSSLPNEGKSLTAANLAISLAHELDYTVLLVDADLRGPSLHRYFDIEQRVGVAEVLMGEAEVADAIIPTGIGKLSLLTAGRAVDNPAELFSSQRMKALVRELKRRYPDRYVIFDTAPVLPFAETRSLAHLVDGVLFLVMERLAPQESIQDALESLKGAQILGVVYNAATLTGSNERYSYYRGYRTAEKQS